MKLAGRILLALGTLYFLLVLGAFLQVHDFGNRWPGLVLGLVVVTVGAVLIRAKK